MPSLALALLALAPPTDSGVALESPPKPGTVVSAPLTIEGEAQALEGVLKVELYVVRGRAVRLVETYEPALPVGVGAVPFSFTFDPEGMRPGTVTIRVVATTLARGFRAEAPGLVVPKPSDAVVDEPVRPAVRPVVVRPRPVPPAARAVRRAAAPAAPRLDDSGRAFGQAAPLLPYRPVRAPRPAAARPPVTVAAPQPLPPDRQGWVSVAGGLLLLLVSSHLHRALRTQPDPRDGR
jgi:hypothetical protein